LLRLLLPLLCILLLSLAPRPLAAVQALRQASRLAEHASTPGDSLRAASAQAEAARRLPWRTDLWEKAGALALQGEDPRAAIAYFEASPRLSLPAQIQLGRAYEAVGALPAARQAWEAALAQAPAVDQPELLENLSTLALSQGDWEGAQSALERLLALRPEEAQNHYRLGLLLSVLEPSAARPSLKRAVELDPALSKPVDTLLRSLLIANLCPDPACELVESGRALGSLGEWTLAGAAFERAVELRPDYAEAWAFLGEARQHLDDEALLQASPAAGGQAPPEENDSALAALQKARALDPGSVSTRLLLALYWQRQGDLDQALENAQAAANLAPRSPAVQAELGGNLAQAGDLPAALEAYQRASGLAPHDPAYLRLLAAFTLQYDHQVREVGLPIARRAVLLTPGDPASLVTLGQVLFKLGDLVNAGRFFRRALALDPGYAPAHLHLGLVHLLQNEPDRALEQFTLVRSLAAGTPLAEQAERIIAGNFVNEP
jgi:tetratricopeptide (TPR) repeat protein